MIGISLLTLVPGEIGGAETYARGLARGLAEVGTLDYLVFAPPVAPGAGGGLPEVVVPEYRARAHDAGAGARDGAGGRPARAAAAALRGARRRPLPADGRAPAAGRCRRPSRSTTSSTSTCRSSSPAPSASSAPGTPTRPRRAARDAVIVPSQFVRRGVVERLGVPPERVHAIPLGLDHERFRPTGEDRESRSSSIPRGPGRTRTTSASSRPSRSCGASGRSSSSC